MAPADDSPPDAAVDPGADPADLTLEELDAATRAEPESDPVSYTGTDFDAEGLVRRLGRGDIIVPNFGHGDDTLELAGFQRGFVWRRPQMDRFIESLLLGFPIPGIMLVQQTDKRYLVLDGQQRLKTLQAFYKGVHAGKEFALENVAEEYKGLTYETLSSEQRRTLDNTFIQATIVRADGSPGSLDSVYQVFERLNSGGTQLTPHEIRIALYPGPLVDLLAELNRAPGWREIYGPESPRLRDHELILRILSFYLRSAEYAPPLKKFLNDFMRDHRDLSRLPVQDLARLFEQATSALSQAGARQVLRRSGQRINAALVEAVVVASMRRAVDQKDMSAEAIERGLRVVADDRALAASTAAATTTEENTRTRLVNATTAFSG